MKPTIALFLYDPKCSVQSGNGIIRALQSNYNFKIFSINELEDNFFDDVDIVAVPGGFGDASTFSRAFKHNGQQVKKFVQSGGKYLGICMGAYWAGRHYFDLLKDVDAVQYLSRPGTDTRRPHAKNISVNWNGELTKMFWYDGCAFVGNGRYKTIATYANGDPMAIVQGSVGLVGCHLESQAHWYTKKYMQAQWHANQHHVLLAQFVADYLLQSRQMTLF
jgi:glutamine amidotransferase-like uncharacterized protein